MSIEPSLFLYRYRDGEKDASRITDPKWLVPFPIVDVFFIMFNIIRTETGAYQEKP